MLGIFRCYVSFCNFFYSSLSVQSKTVQTWNKMQQFKKVTKVIIGIKCKIWATWQQIVSGRVFVRILIQQTHYITHINSPWVQWEIHQMRDCHFHLYQKYWRVLCISKNEKLNVNINIVILTRGAEVRFYFSDFPK